MQDILIARTSTDLRYIVLSHLPSIGTHMRPNLELIVGIGPDLVLQMGGREEAVQTVYDLERLGITVAYFSVSTFEDLFRVIKQMGVLTSSEDAATDLERKMRERLAAVSMALAMTHERPSVFFEVRSPNLLTVGKQSLVTEIIEKAGGINCIKSNRKLLRINDEEVFRLSPDYYILQKGPMNQTPVPMTHRPRMSRLEAVIKGRWQIVEENLFSRPGPGNVEAVEQLAKILHPTSFQNEPKQ